MFILSTDTCIDLAKHKLDALNIKYLTMNFTVDGAERPDDFDSDEDYKNFYRMIQDGKLIKTSQCGLFETEEYFRRILRENTGDVVHFCLSSGISGTYNNAVAAAQTVMNEPEFKNRVIFCVDTRSGAAGLSSQAG